MRRGRMGIWDVTKRIIQGKPGFDVSPQVDDWNDDDEPTTDFAEDQQYKKQALSQSTPNNAVGTKHIPIMTIHRVHTIVSGANTEIWMLLKNLSDREVFLDKITLLGIKFELDYPLHPGGERDFRVYRGPLLRHDHYKTAEIYYRDAASRDYFRANQLLQYSYKSDSTYEITEAKLIPPVCDV